MYYDSDVCETFSVLCKCGCLSKVDYGVDVGVTVSLVRCLVFATGNLKSVTECYRKASVYVDADVSIHLCILSCRSLLIPSANQICRCSWFGVCVRNF